MEISDEIQTSQEARILLGKELYYKDTGDKIGRVTELFEDGLRIGPKRLDLYVLYGGLFRYETR